MKSRILFAAALTVLLNAFATQVKWTCKFPDAVSQNFTAYHGETIEFKPELYANGVKIVNPSMSLYWQTNGMGEAWWHVPGTTFAPTNDVGADVYRFFVRAEGEDGILYRANGRLKMLASPGFVPSEVELPARSLDFSRIAYANAPWLTADATNALWEAKSDKSELDSKQKILPLLDWVLIPEHQERWHDQIDENYWNKTFRIPVAYANASYTSSEAEMAWRDGNDNIIHDTYATKTELSAATNANAIDVSAQLGPLADAMGAATNRLETVEQNVNRMYVNSQGSNVWFSVTNYDSVVRIASLRLNEIHDGKEKVVWDELRMHEKTFDDAVNAAADMDAVIVSNMPNRAWGLVTSGTGAAAPADTTYVSTRYFQFCPGYEWEYIANGSHGVNVLCGMASKEFGISTNGTFAVMDGKKNVLFKIETSKHVAVDVRIEHIDVDNTGAIGVTVKKRQGLVTMLEAPTLSCGDSVNGPFYDQDDPLCAYDVTWVTNMTDEAYVATAIRRDGNTDRKGFFYFHCDDKNFSGSSKHQAVFTMPVMMPGVMSSDGTKVATPRFNPDGSVEWRWK